MRVSNTQRLVLVGLSGVGKSTTGRIAAERLGWNLIDTDADLEREAGMTVPEMFRNLGEPAFRQMERALLARSLDRDDVVIACGGGAVVDPSAWTPELLGRSRTLVVALDADPATSLARLRRQQLEEGAAVVRPLIQGDDPLGRLTSMKQDRLAAYRRAAITLMVDGASPEEIGRELARLTQSVSVEPDVILRTPTGESHITVGSGAVDLLPDAVRQASRKARRVWVITDANVAIAHGDAVMRLLADAGFDARIHAVPAGEGSKSIAGITALWDWMLSGGAERSDVVVALGGGVVGDLAGFAAATVLRGVGLVQVPTSLLATVDSSVGGKTGINHPAGKNLIGAFNQPQVVLIDPNLMRSAPPRELGSGWAEVIKHGVIQRSTPGGERGDLSRFLDANSPALLRYDDPALSYVIRRNVALKAAVVEADEREAGIRAYLNFGHTLGHAIEAADYALLHGEAIAVGMRAAMRIGQRIGTCDGETVEALDRQVTRFGLPLTARTQWSAVLAKLGSDKKKDAGTQKWVMPLTGGGVELRTDVPLDIVQLVFNEVNITSDSA